MKSMHFFFLVCLFGLGLAAKPANLHVYGAGYQSFYACGSYIVSNIHYSTKPKDYSVFCTNPEAIATLVGCYADENRLNRADTAFWIKQCDTIFSSPISYDNITQGYKYLLESGVSFVDLGNYTAGQLDVPVIVPRNYSLAAKETYNMWIGNYNDSVYFGAGALAYWGLVCILSGIANWSLILFPGLRRSMDGKVSRLWRKYVTLPALMRKKKSTSHTFLKVLCFIVPSRLESLIIFVFFWLLFILNAVRIYAVKNDTFFASEAAAFNRYVADRAGIICVMMLPLLILFGGRNNFLMWVTRWQFSRFVTFHRWIARLEVLMAFIHGMCLFRTFDLAGTRAAETSQHFVIWGIVALFSGVVICFQGLLFLRRCWYEVFLVLHIVLAAFFVIGAWHHVYALGYSQFLYATIAVWAFDRMVRVFRVLYFGFPRAEVSLFSDDTIKVRIPKPARWHATACGYSYVYFMHSYKFWQSHPFTYIDSGSHVTFFCKAKTGITKSIKDHLINLPGGITHIRVAVEGPYGESHPVKQHSDVVFIAAGNGIPGPFSEFEHLKNAADSKQKLKLNWVIRETSSFTWMSQEFQRCQFSKNAEITVYVTKPNLGTDSDELSRVLNSDYSSGDESRDEKEEKSLESDTLFRLAKMFPHISFKEGRPDLKNIIEGDIEEAQDSIAFVVCGTPQMVDEVRYQVVNNIDQTSKRVDFYEALEVWA